jgi:hypothetical protein
MIISLESVSIQGFQIPTRLNVATFFTNLGFQRPLWTGPNLKREDRKNFKLLFVLGLISLEASAEIYIRLPQDLMYGSNPIPIERLSKVDKYDVVIFPGAGGPDQYTDALKNKIADSDKHLGITRGVYVYDWLKWRGNFLRAAFDGQSVGKTIGTQLSESKNLENIHIIGISVGAFAADSCVKQYKELAENPATIHLTLLDPFTSKGPFGYGWGLQHFGAGADIVEDYLNSDDPVPTTNDPVLNAYTIDVTNSKSRAGFTDSYHSWPVAYLAKNWDTQVDRDGHIVEPLQENLPRGKVVIAP